MENKSNENLSPESAVDSDGLQTLENLKRVETEKENVQASSDSPGQASSDSPGQASSVEVETAVLLVPLVGALCMVFAPDWEVSPGEQKMLAEAWSPVVDKYLPGGVGIEGTAIAATFAVIAPRLGKPRKKSRSAAPGKKLENNSGHTVTVNDVIPTSKKGDPDGEVKK